MLLWSHNPKVAGSNPAPATEKAQVLPGNPQRYETEPRNVPLEPIRHIRVRAARLGGSLAGGHAKLPAGVANVLTAAGIR